MCSLSTAVTAVLDVTLNFKDKQTPTLLGIVNGKKYKADMMIRWVQLHPHRPILMCRCRACPLTANRDAASWLVLWPSTFLWS